MGDFLTCGLEDDPLSEYAPTEAEQLADALQRRDAENADLRERHVNLHKTTDGLWAENARLRAENERLRSEAQANEYTDLEGAAVAQSLTLEIGALRAKLDRILDLLHFAARAEGGLLDQIERLAQPREGE